LPSKQLLRRLEFHGSEHHGDPSTTVSDASGDGKAGVNLASVLEYLLQWKGYDTKERVVFVWTSVSNSNVDFGIAHIADEMLAARIEEGLGIFRFRSSLEHFLVVQDDSAVRGWQIILTIHISVFLSQVDSMN
jgi:hypothetical protein